jgi:hypothetical protein
MGRSSADHAAIVEYLYVPCVGTRHDGCRAEARRWVQEVPIIKKTAKWIYYASDSWNRREAIVSPGCISRAQFEADAGPLFFATREAAEEDLHRGEREQAGRAGRDAALLRELRRAMADSHPDRGGTVEEFIQAHRRYQAVLRGR